MGQAELEDYAHGMCGHVNNKSRDNASIIFDGACGFSILSGSPIFAPDTRIDKYRPTDRRTIVMPTQSLPQAKGGVSIHGFPCCDQQRHGWAAISKDMDGGPSPTMTVGYGP
jgi:hypothetical protein